MGLTRKDESVVVRLRSNIQRTNKNKKQILNYVNELKKKCENREITILNMKLFCLKKEMEKQSNNG